MRTIRVVEAKGNGGAELERETRIALIQALIPLGLEAVKEELGREVEELAGSRYRRRDGRRGHVRWGRQRGSIYLGDQKLPLSVPRVRDLWHGMEVPLEGYRRLREPRELDEGLLRRVLAGVACREYERCAEAVPQAFGLSSSSVSRRYIRATARKLRELQERRLEGHDLVALFLDGKSFAEDELVIALGVTLTGAKVVLGFVQTATENARVCGAFLRELVERGLRFEQGLLVVIDGAKGLRKAVAEVFAEFAQVQRCQWHKRENVVAHLPKAEQARWRRKLGAAYEKPTYAEAKAGLERLKAELALVNRSAAASLEEGLEETLTLHRLGLFPELATSFKTTNCLDSILAQVERRTGKVTHWRTSDQKQRWVATALLDLEPRLRRVKGFRYLPTLREALQASRRAEVA